jgi:phosphogluconate dehydratase
VTTIVHSILRKVTERIRERSKSTRAGYVRRMQAATSTAAAYRQSLSCGNLAHAFASSPVGDKLMLRSGRTPNVGIVTSYNDMLSAHQPFLTYPEVIKEAARQAGATAQVAGGVPAMCDGVTQGQLGMELSLFSRDVIAQATAVALSHNMFDATLCLGVCDKIVPGLLIGALSFGHLPTVFVPAGPMPTGISNKEKSDVRSRYAEGKASRSELLAAEAASYHTSGTCTFYGTANSNQMLMEIMGLHIPGAAFVAPGTKLREVITRAATAQAIKNAASGSAPLWQIVDENSLVNGIVGLLATGGSTNHTIHLVAIARAAGIIIDWDDFDELSAHVPLLARVYPNGPADVNQFHAAGGIGFVIRELMGAGLLHGDVQTTVGRGLVAYTREPLLDPEGQLCWRRLPPEPGNKDIVRTISDPYEKDGGLRKLTGNLGRAVMKVSAVSSEHRVVEAPARVFDDQDGLLKAFKDGELNKDVVAVVRFQGPMANGMPELHKLTPALTVLQNRGLKVALVSDGRMSGASGKVAAAIHVSPEAVAGGTLAKVLDGDLIRVDGVQGRVDVLVPAAILEKRQSATMPNLDCHGMGRELFAGNRMRVSSAETGALSIM